MEPIHERIEDFMRRYGRVLAVAVLLVAMLVSLAGCGEARLGHNHLVASPYVAEPRRVPKPKTCSEYANERQILLDEQAGRLTKADKQWLDMDGDGRYCEERSQAWKGERTQAQ